MLHGRELRHCAQWVLLYKPGIQANRIHWVRNLSKIQNTVHGPGTDSGPVSNSANIIHLTIENYFIISRSVTTIRNLLILLPPSGVWYTTKVVTTLLQPSS